MSKEYYKKSNPDEYIMDELISDLKSKYLSMWWNTKTKFPPFKKVNTYWEKISKEREINNFIKEFTRDIQSFPKNENEKLEWREKIIDSLKEFAKNTLKASDEDIDILFSEGYLNTTKEFINEAKRYDPLMGDTEIIQALRNAWIMNSLQIFLDLEVTYSPSIFAYSMLYPFTDNYLDDSSIPIHEKTEFNCRFRKRLAGEKVEPTNKHELDIFKLVEMIEEQFPREDYPRVYESLLAIQRAQEDSLFQQSKRTIPYEKDILGISFEKGGTSVLADGFLVNGDLTRDEASFVFGYGIFLQLVDDLHDIKEDFKNVHMTIYSQNASKWPLDDITNKLFWFIKNILDSSNGFSTDRTNQLRKLIETSCIYLVFEAVAKNKKMFSKKYIKQIKQRSIVRFSYQKKLERKLKKLFSTVNLDNVLVALGTSDSQFI